MSDAALEDWHRVTLSEVADISRGTSWRDDNEVQPGHEDALPVLGIKNVQDRLDLSNVTWLKGLPQSAIKSSTVQDGDILMVGSNGNPDRIGNAVRIDVPGRYLYASLLFGLRPRTETADSEFLFHLIRSSVIQSAISETVQGTTGLSNLKISVLREIPLTLPPLDEQRRIAEVLRSVDVAIITQSEVCDQLQVTFNCLAEACFAVGDGSANNVWPIFPLGEQCESIQVGIVVRPASYYVETGGVPALRSLNLSENRLDLDDLVYISAEGHRLNSKSSLRPGDVVTRRTGEPGKTAVIPSQFPDGLNCIDIIFSRPNASLRADFLSFFMNSDAAKGQVTGLQGGLAQQHLNVGEMKKLKVPVPTIQAQDEVVATLKAAWDRVEREKALLDRLFSLRSAIGVDLLSGRVLVPA
jgi:type I restriction enzyme S subunit